MTIIISSVKAADTNNSIATIAFELLDTLIKD